MSHTVVKQFPDNIKLLPTVGGSLEPSFWDGVELPILIQPHFGKIPVYYSESKSPSLTAFGVDSFTFEDVSPVAVRRLVATCEKESPVNKSMLKFVCIFSYISLGMVSL